MDARRKPFEADRDTAHYWEALGRGSFEIQHCRDCAHWTWPPRIICSKCHGENLSYEQPKGTGTVYSWIVTHRSFDPTVPAPHTVVLVRLDEEPDILIAGRLISDQEAHQGMRVRAAPEQVADGMGRLNWTSVD
jgi:uncharacterized OB-fold protein